VSEWTLTTLGDVLRVEHGFAFKGEHFSMESGDVLLTPKNFGPSGGLEVSAHRCKYYAGSVEERFILRAGDIVMAMTDLKQDAPILGSTGVVPAGRRYLHNQRIGKIVISDPDRLDRRFAPWLLNSPSVRRGVRATATGATVRHTAPSRVAAIRVLLPDRTLQARIAAVLSAFDDLIQINERRIELLEDLARSLYREWFVHFRFPGYDNAEFVDLDGAPLRAEWRAGKLGDIADLNGKKVNASDIPDPFQYLDISSVGVGKLEAPIVMPAVEAPGRARRQVSDGDVVWATVRPNRRSHALIHDPSPDLVVSTGLAVLTPVAAPSSFLFEYVASDEFSSYLIGRASGAAYPAVRPDDFKSAPVLLPPQPLLERFDEMVDPMLRSASVLRRRNWQFATIRDLLLPRLVSGQLDISDIDLGPLTPAETE
jgi:type I restriction enzyme, S subunit